MTRVSVIIATRNRRDSLLRSLAALQQQNFSAAEFEVIVVADRCTDDTEAAVADLCWRNVSVIRSRAPGQAAANNTGADVARGDLAIFIDDEMRPVADFVSAHVVAHRTQAMIAVTGYSPIVLAPDSTPVERFVAAGYRRFHERLSQPDRSHSPLDLNGGNFSIRLDHLRAASGFNESYFFQRNDFELAARLMQRGFTIGYAPEAEAHQEIALTSSALVARAVPRALNDVRLAHEFPWCVRYLPFARAFADKRVRARWRVLWEIGGYVPSAVSGFRSLLKDSVLLMNWEYGARYIAEIKNQLGSWSAFESLARR